MLQAKELEKLVEIINNHEKTLQQIEGQFLVSFNQNLAVFHASFTLTHLLSHNLLTLPQRIIAIFLLVQNYKAQGIKRNPFGATILSISQKTNQLFEKRMISDLLLDAKREKYSKMKVEELFDQQQLMIQNVPQKPQMKKLREEFIYQVPPISLNRNVELQNIIPNYNYINNPPHPPEQFNTQALKNKQIEKMGFSIGKMRPIPSFIKISQFQMSWISPGVIADVHWDNIVDIQKKLAKIKGHIKKGLQTKLSKQQSTEIDRCLQNDAYAVLNLDLTPENLILLINNNPYVAVSFLAKLGNYQIIGDYLQSLLDAPIGINCVDVVVRLIKVSKIPTAFIETFTLKNLKQSQEIAQNNKDKVKTGRVISKFLLYLSKNNIIDLRMYSQDIKAFIKCFKELEDVQDLQFLMAIATQT